MIQSCAGRCGHFVSRRPLSIRANNQRSRASQLSDCLCPRIIHAVLLELRNLNYVASHRARFLADEPQPLLRLCIVHECRGKHGLADEDSGEADSFGVNGFTDGSQNIDQ